MGQDHDIDAIMEKVAEIDRNRKLISCEGSGARIPFCLEPREISLNIDTVRDLCKDLYRLRWLQRHREKEVAERDKVLNGVDPGLVREITATLRDRGCREGSVYCCVSDPDSCEENWKLRIRGRIKGQEEGLRKMLEEFPEFSRRQP